jgi:alkanesulfonate monooxygenase SsuD/methylene tetrahydromethanopterin reductase-like flavin-dependent oxidoreductase (luciferase family)
LTFGVTTIPNVRWDELVAHWHAVDRLPRIETLWLPDHLFKGWYECWAALGGVACATKRVRFGPLVSPLASHEPARLARAATTVDAAGAGRLELGVGTGGDWRSFEARTDELVGLTGDIPLTVGGAGATALRVAAKHAHRWNYSPGRGDAGDAARARGRELNARLDDLAGGRTILRSALIAYPFAGEDGTPLDELVAAWAAAGFEELIVDYPGPFTAALVQG